jgi:threonine synthase
MLANLSRSQAMSLLSHLECPECARGYNADELQTVCPECGSPLLARYDLTEAKAHLDPRDLVARPNTMWRWYELLPVRDPAHIITLAEGGTPLLHTPHLGKALGLAHLYVKDEGRNPTGTFKARGIGMAVSRAVELGVKGFVIPTAGNAGGALAAYAARAGWPAHVFMPVDAPPSNQQEVEMAGAHLHLVNGLISDAGRESAAMAKESSLFDVSTLKEPYRLEGKKTMGYEIAFDFDWHLPDVILYPTGGGTGLIGIWKAFDELERLGWIGAHRPRMVCVQAQGCAPMVKAYDEGRDHCEFFTGAQTIAAGLRVPKPLGDRLILRAVRESHGTAITVTDDEMIAARALIASTEGVQACLEGSATVAALRKLIAAGWVKPDERVVCLNTGTGFKDPV